MWLLYPFLNFVIIVLASVLNSFVRMINPLCFTSTVTPGSVFSSLQPKIHLELDIAAIPSVRCVFYRPTISTSCGHRVSYVPTGSPNFPFCCMNTRNCSPDCCNSDAHLLLRLAGGVVVEIYIVCFGRFTHFCWFQDL